MACFSASKTCSSISREVSAWGTGRASVVGRQLCMQLRQHRQQLAVDGVKCGQMDRGGKRVVARLAKIDVVVWTHGLLGVPLTGKQLIGALGNDLVGIHVLGALCLRAVVNIARHSDITESIALDLIGGHGRMPFQVRKL